MDKQIKQQERAKCHRCGSTLVYARLKTKEIVCRSCGFIDKMNTEIK